MRNKIIQSFIKTCITIIIVLSSSNICYADVDINALQGYLNGKVAQQQVMQSNNPKYSDRNGQVETIDPITGSLILKQNDISLPGKDGLDLNIGRIYRSSQDEYVKRVSLYYESTTTVIYVQGYFLDVTFLRDGKTNYNSIGPLGTYAEAYARYLEYKSMTDVDKVDLIYGIREQSQPTSTLVVDNGTDKYEYNKTRYYLGAGWSLAFPSVQIEVENDTKYLYYHDGSGNTYKVSKTEDTGNSNLEGYQGNDVKFVSDNGTYKNQDNIASKYKFINSDLTTTYFAEDGRILGIKDRLNNEIKFRHINQKIYDKTFPLISQITDSVGRVISFTYINDNIDIAVKAPNESNQIHVTYKRIFMTREITRNGKVIDNYQYPILDYVTDAKGRNTYYKNYNDGTLLSDNFSFLYKTLHEHAGPRYLLGAVEYQGSRTVYEYEKTIHNYGADGLTEEYRIKSRHDELQRYNNSTQSKEWLPNYYNKVDYTYSGLDYTGFPDHPDEEKLPATYQFWSESTDGNGLKTKNIFNGSKQLIQTEITASNNEKKVVKNLEFNTNYKYLPTKTETSEYASDGSLAHKYYTGTTYTDWGGISSSTAPLTEQQYADANTKKKYTTSYSYENATYKYFQTKKQWYQNDTTILNETYSYDTLGRISSCKNAKNETVSYTYSNDSNGNKIEEITQQLENGKTARTRQVYNSGTGYSYPSEIINYYTDKKGTKLEKKITRTYNMLFGLVKSETDNQNRTTTYTYDELGRVISIQLPDFVNTNNESTSPRQEFKYTDGFNMEYSDGPINGIYGTTVNSSVIYRVNASNITRTFSQSWVFYDSYGNTRYENLWDSEKKVYLKKSHYTYDNMGRVISSTDAEGNTVTLTYNAWSQNKESVDANGNLYVTDYDVKNNKIMSFFVAAGNIASYRANINSNTYKEDYTELYYDQFGRTTERRVYENWPTLSGALSELYKYDIQGNLTGYTDPKRNLNEDGVTTTYQYDGLNRINTLKDAMNQITSIYYTVLGNISSIALKQNVSSATSINLYTKSYDELGSIMGKTDPSAAVTEYNYNTVGLITGVVDRNLNKSTMSYDGLSRLMQTSQTSADSKNSIQHLYNYWQPYGYSSDKMTINNTLTTSINYSYNDNSQITKKDVTGNGYINSNLKLTYDNAGRLNSVGAGVLESNYFYTNYKYTKDRLTQVQTNGQLANSTVDTNNVIYEYYPDGKLKKITYPKLNDASYLTTEYNYNPLGRMTSMINKKGSKVLSQFTYTYDANGNITSVYDGKTTKTYVYDKLNRLSEIQPQGGIKTAYTYDLRGNRLTEVSNNFNQEFINTSYTYDVENKLQTVTKGTATTTMKYNADGSRAKKETSAGYTNYIYNLSGKVVAEAKNSAAVTSNYIWGPDRVLAKKVVGGSDYYYLYNGHGDVVQVVDRNGNIVNNYQYDEWGNILSNNETVSNPFKYAGEVYDEETGLYYLRARYYDPSIGRFINEDTYEGQIINPLSLNLYTYCYNSPSNLVDPSGNLPIIPLLIYLFENALETIPDVALDVLLEGTKFNFAQSCLVNFFINLVPGLGEIDSGRKVAKIAAKYGDDVVQYLAKNGDEVSKYINNYGTGNLKNYIIKRSDEFAKEINKTWFQKATKSSDYLNEALSRQGLQNVPIYLKEKWSEFGYDFEVRIHPADPRYDKTGSIYRVARRKQGVDSHGQGFGWQYMDESGNWYSESFLKTSNTAAEATHIQLP